MYYFEFCDKVTLIKEAALVERGKPKKWKCKHAKPAQHLKVWQYALCVRLNGISKSVPKTPSMFVSCGSESASSKAGCSYTADGVKFATTHVLYYSASNKVRKITKWPCLEISALQ